MWHGPLAGREQGVVVRKALAALDSARAAGLTFMEIKAMENDVTSAVVDLLSRNRGPDPLNPGSHIRPNYGVNAILDEDVLRVELTFRAGAAYCCMEWGCHLPLHKTRRWDTLRRELTALGIAVPPRLRLQLSCVVETGARFFDPSRPDPTRRGWYAFASRNAYEYQVSTVEAPEAGDG